MKRKLVDVMMLRVNKKNATIYYTVIQALYFMIGALVFCYASMYLLHRGMSNSQIGITLGISYFLSALLQPGIAMFVEKTGVRLGTCMAVLYAVLAAAAMTLLLVPLHGAILIAVMIVVFMLQSAMQSSLNSLHIGYNRNGASINFSLARGVGSVVFSLSNLCAGRLLTRMSVDFLPVLYLVPALLLIVVLLLFHAPNVEVENPKAVRPEEKALLLLKYPHFYLFLAGLTCLSITHTFTENYLLQIIQRFGGTGANLGTAFAIASITELPAMLLYNRISQKVGNRRLLCFAGWMWATKNFLIMIAPNIYVVYAAELLQFMSYAIYVPAAVHYISHAIPQSEFLKGQSLAGSAFTVGSIFSAFVGGRLIDMIGITHTLYLVQIFSLAGVVLFTVAMFGSIRHSAFTSK